MACRPGIQKTGTGEDGDKNTRQPPGGGGVFCMTAEFGLFPGPDCDYFEVPAGIFPARDLTRGNGSNNVGA